MSKIDKELEIEGIYDYEKRLEDFLAWLAKWKCLQHLKKRLNKLYHN